MQAEVEWAAWAGQHALPLFLEVLAMLLAGLCACWWILRRYTASQAIGLVRLMRLRIAIGCSTILLGAGTFSALAGQLGAGAGMTRVDQAFASALPSNVMPLVLKIFTAFTHLGDTVTLTVLGIGIASALVAMGLRELALGWVAAVLGNGLLNTILKLGFARTRPLTPDGLTLSEGFSFPSGHSSGSVVAYGMLAYLALRLLPARWHLPSLVAAVSLAFTVGASRLFLRVHFASDVLAGFASGAAWLAVCITSLELASWYRRTGDREHPGSAEAGTIPS